MVKKEFFINLNEIEDLKTFVNEMTYHIKSDVDAIYERQVIDAKSILGVFSLDLDNVLTLEVVIPQGDILSQDIIDKINQFACKGE